jgi:hypothetical protein
VVVGLAGGGFRGEISFCGERGRGGGGAAGVGRCRMGSNRVLRVFVPKAGWHGGGGAGGGGGRGGGDAV